MRPGRWFFELATLVLIFLAPSGNAWACSCPEPGPPCQNAFRADAVFVGTVLSITPLSDDGSPLPPGVPRFPRAIRVDLSVGEAFRGIQGSTVSVLTDGATCRYPFQQGQRYLVYASRSTQSGELGTGICSRTRPIADATEDLQFLQTLSGSTTAGGRLYGRIAQWETSVSGVPGEHDPLPNVLVSARNDVTSSNARTDAQGRYEIAVPPGKYEITIEPVPGFSTRHLSRSVELHDARACSVADFHLQFDGRIRGVVRIASGDAADGVIVEAMREERIGSKAIIETLRTTAGPGGVFEFTEVPRGRYVIGVDLVRRREPKVMFPPTYHPGTSDPALATIVQLDGGHHIELDPLTLPPPRRSYQLTGTVFFEDGRPAPAASVTLRDAGPMRLPVGGISTNSDGTFSLVVHEGLSYAVSANYFNAVERKQLLGSVGPIVVAGDIGPVKIVLSE